MTKHSLLTRAEAAALDQAAIAAGLDSFALLERAGLALAAEIMARYPVQPVLIVCGHGHNGGDGLVIAEKLRQAAWPVCCVLVGESTTLPSAVQQAYQAFQGDIQPWSAAMLAGQSLVIDALFGIGLNRALSPPYCAIIRTINDSGVPIIAIDMPSGLDANSGAVLGAAIKATLTLTITRPKAGLLLLSGRDYAGEIGTVDIGLAPDTLSPPPLFAENHPDLWRDTLPTFTATQHKYDHGHALILGGAIMSGAARLAARAAQRSGCGLVTIATPPSARLIYASNLDSVLVQDITTLADWQSLLNDHRKTAILLGPGAGTSEALREQVLATLATGKPCVLDADALTCFADKPETLLHALHPHTILTPHSGEFARLFGQQQQFSDKLSLVSRMARLLNCVILLKGADTVIACPDGRAVINTNAPPWLATAGSGDVLAGIITGLLAQGMPAFAATCCAVWLHGQAAQNFQPGMIAEDLILAVPKILALAKAN